jgi:hypothetical protein
MDDTHRPIPPALSAAQLARWTRLRDELAQLNAQLEYLHLILRLQAGRRS